MNASESPQLQIADVCFVGIDGLHVAAGLHVLTIVTSHC